MINFIICDDNDEICINVKNIIFSFMIQNKIEYKTHIFKDYDKSFIDIVKQKLSFKIYILDIETPTSSGIDIARLIRKKDYDSIIIFLTCHEELGMTILKDELYCLSFINKFDDYHNKLTNALKQALKLLKKKNILNFEDRGVTYSINIDDILYITRDTVTRRCIIKTDYNEFKTYKALYEISKMLDNRFIRTHRACIVNKERVNIINKLDRTITFDNGTTIDLLSSKYKKGIL